MCDEAYDGVLSKAQRAEPVTHSYLLLNVVAHARILMLSFSLTISHRTALLLVEGEGKSMYRWCACDSRVRERREKKCAHTKQTPKTCHVDRHR